MATFTVYFSDSGVAATGLTVAFEYLKKASDNTNVSTAGATIVEIGGGWYKITGLNPDELWVGVMDGSNTLANADRYVPIAMEPEDYNYEAHGIPVYNETSDQLKIAAFLSKNGQRVTTNLTNCSIIVYDENHAALFTITSASATNGVFFVTKTTPRFVKNKLYYAAITITHDGVGYVSTDAIIAIE